MRLLIPLLFLTLAPFAQASTIISPAHEEVVNNDATTFSFSTDGGSGAWIMFSPSGAGFCADSLAGYESPTSRSFVDWASACGTSPTLGDGVYRLVVATNRVSGLCNTDGTYEDCAGSAQYVSTTEVWVGDLTPPNPSTTTEDIFASSTTLDIANFAFTIALGLISVFLALIIVGIWWVKIFF